MDVYQKLLAARTKQKTDAPPVIVINGQVKELITEKVQELSLNIDIDKEALKRRIIEQLGGR